MECKILHNTELTYFSKAYCFLETDYFDTFNTIGPKIGRSSTPKMVLKVLSDNLFLDYFAPELNFMKIHSLLMEYIHCLVKT